MNREKMRKVGWRSEKTNDLRANKKFRRGKIQAFMWSQTKTISRNGGSIEARIAQSQSTRRTNETMCGRPITNCFGILARVSYLFSHCHGQFSRKLPQNIQRIAARKLEQLHAATVLDTLRIPPGNRLEALSGNRQGQHSIRLNSQWRLCFVWRDSNAFEVEIVDYH